VSSDRELCELFHFLFLERLLRTTSPELYVLKGGVNLRFFHQSPRYSEDLDLDVHQPEMKPEQHGARVERPLRDEIPPVDLGHRSPRTLRFTRVPPF
jgi:predicted nucleotidyltransferase component of viral defense system